MVACSDGSACMSSSCVHAGFESKQGFPPTAAMKFQGDKPGRRQKKTALSKFLKSTGQAFIQVGMLFKQDHPRTSEDRIEGRR